MTHLEKPTGMEKLTVKTVRQIRRAYDGVITVEGLSHRPTQGELSTQFGVNESTIQAICKGRTWQRVTPPLCFRSYKGGRRTGAQSHLQKVGIEERELIRRKQRAGETVADLAKRYRVSRTTIYRILQEV